MKEVNLMQGVFTKILNLWIPNKTDKGTVVTDVFEPNFTKLDQYAETTNRSLEDLKNNKLDKGTYSGNAVDLKDEIDKVASTTQLGRIKVGTNLRIDENGFLHGNPAVDISGKLDKGDVPVKYDTAEKIGIELDKKQNIEDNELITNAKTIVGAINENYEKFKNFCPVPIGWLAYIDTEEHPATRYLGTTWVKLEDVFIKGTKSGEVSGQTGGSNTKTISKANLPNIKLQVDSFSVTTKKHTHGYRNFQYMSGINIGNGGNGTNWVTSQTGEAGGDNTGTASPYTSTLGSGTALDITPAYYTVHIWKRLS